MDENILLFFDKKPEALALYETFERKVMEQISDVRKKVQKTQISFSNKYMFACVSFARVRKARECPPVYIVVTFGLDHRQESSRIDVATEAYPGRWTHHVLIASEEEIDEELMGWVREAAAFSLQK